jgi:hypothetical protein
MSVSTANLGQVFWEGAMDPSQQYQVKVTNLNGGSYTDIHSVRHPLIQSLPSVNASYIGCHDELAGFVRY